ncbi:MAG: hypothetical protein ABL914_12260 [Novosphingobium sp.]|uniref:hypothetical protein n=1 Tax=Novosphingobium sp. TaxID=1874826 RepID=UPI0032BA177C
MAFNGSDYFQISRAGTNYKCLGSDVLAYVQSNLGTAEYRVADITARNALNAQLSAGDRVMVDDATLDGTVIAGWALYQWLASNTWRKIAEQESLDITVGGATNLSYTAGPLQGIVVSDSGSDAILPAADAVNAGLMLPAHKAKVDFLTVTAAFDADASKAKLALIGVTQAVDLDVIEAASHAAVTTAGTAANNPIVATGQALSFNIAGLTSAP